jgi:hypothetical protein
MVVGNLGHPFVWDLENNQQVIKVINYYPLTVVIILKLLIMFVVLML